MAIAVIKVEKNNNENGASVLRRFSRRAKESGIVRLVKSRRYATRKTSKLSTKDRKLKQLVRQKETIRMKKLGKMGS